MNTCNTCRHWSAEGSFKTGYVGKDGKFVERTVVLTHRDCLNPALCLYFNDDHKGHEFSRLDGIMGHGMRKPVTGPKFGCIHWEKKLP